MTNQKTPTTLADEDLDAVQGAGRNYVKTATQKGEKTIMHEEQETILTDRESPGRGLDPKIVAQTGTGEI